MTVDYEDIYRRNAGEYDQLVTAEDHEGNLKRALAELAPLRGAQVLEVGAGTGRVTRILLEEGATVRATEVSAAMAHVAGERLAPFPAERWSMEVADARSLPTPDGWADLAVAGWVLGHFREWHDGYWRSAVARALAEMERNLRPGGTMVVVETLGTGAESPNPPSPELAEYYAWLEGEHGFARRSIRTDYRFADPREGESLLRLFFGDAMADAFRARGGAELPECTGIWWKRAG